MTPVQLLAQLKSGPPAPVYLFVGPEMYRRRWCRRLMLEKFLPEEERENGLTRHDLDGEITLPDVIDDACSLSLFASRRMILVMAAEAALPRSAAQDKEEQPGQKALAAYLKNPVPDTVLIFDSSRFTFDNDDKSKMDRLRKFYAAIPHVVEFPPYSEEEARKLAGDEAKRAGLKIAAPELEALVEALGYEGARIVNEIEKLALYTGGQRAVTPDDIAILTPDARTTTVFALVAAVGRGDRTASLNLLDTLVREGEYLPLALTFLSTQFRLALAAKEEGLKTAQQIQAHFTRLGIPMFSSRANQVSQTVAAFTKPKLEAGMAAIFAADKGLRDNSPDDRLIMENMVLALTR